MFEPYRVYYNMVFLGYVQALSEKKAWEKGCAMAKELTKAFNSNVNELVTVEKL